MEAQVGTFDTKRGPERRLYIAEWPLKDGSTRSGVTIHPHICSTCIGGDHVHVHTFQTPKTLEEGVVRLSADHVAIVSKLLATQRTLDRITRELHELMG